MSPLEGVFLIVPVFFVLFWLTLFTVHIVFAVLVYQQATADRNAGTRLLFVGPVLWALSTLVTGVIGATCYWLLHHSTLRPDEDLPAAPASVPSAPDNVPHA